MRTRSRSECGEPLRPFPNDRRMIPILLAVTTALTIAAATPAPNHARGTVVSIDAKRARFMLHHEPFPEMQMEMTMEVAPKNPAVIKQLHRGEKIELDIDTSVVPWVGTNIRPAGTSSSKG